MMRTVHVRFSLILIVTVLLLTSAVSAFLPSVTPTSRKVDLSSTRTAAICHANNKNNFLTTWKARLFQKQRRQQQQEKEEKEEQEEQEEQEERQERRNDYEKRKLEWASEHTSVDALRKKFGENQNQMWGDLDARTCRRLYKTLLPKALLELYRVGIEPQDLAPLAYEARLAAKLYARERCVVPARLAAHSYDGFRHWKRYGRFQCTGMTYKQLWEKYRQAILQEDDENNNNNNNNNDNEHDDDSQLLEEDVTARICLKILERSCATNDQVDSWVLGQGGREDQDSEDLPDLEEQLHDLEAITEQLEQEVFDVLEGHKRDTTARRAATLRLLVRAKRRFQRKQNRRHQQRQQLQSSQEQQEQEQEQQEQQEQQQQQPRATDDDDDDKHKDRRDKPWNNRANSIHHRHKTWKNRQ